MTKPKFKIGDVVKVIDTISQIPIDDMLYTIIEVKTITFSWYKAQTQTNKVVWWCEDQLVLEQSS